MPEQDRAAQISAQVAEVLAYEDPEIWNYTGDALSDLAWLLAERAELLRRVEAAEKAGSYENLVTMLALAERERDEALARADAKEPPAT